MCIERDGVKIELTEDEVYEIFNHKRMTDIMEMVSAYMEDNSDYIDYCSEKVGYDKEAMFVDMVNKLNDLFYQLESEDVSKAFEYIIDDNTRNR